MDLPVRASPPPPEYISSSASISAHQRSNRVLPKRGGQAPAETGFAHPTIFMNVPRGASHDLSHHGRDKAKQDKIRQINRFQTPSETCAWSVSFLRRRRDHFGDVPIGDDPNSTRTKKMPGSFEPGRREHARLTVRASARHITPRQPRPIADLSPIDRRSFRQRSPLRARRYSNGPPPSRGEHLTNRATNRGPRHDAKSRPESRNQIHLPSLHLFYVPIKAVVRARW